MNKKLSNALNQIIQSGLLILAILMPFHAFLSLWLGHMLGHQAEIQAWKEGLLVILSALVAVLFMREPQHLQRLRQPWILLAGTLAAIAALVTVFARPPFPAIAFGLKTDLEFLVAGVIAAAVATPVFLRRLVAVIMAGAGLVVGFGLLQMFVLPPDFLTHFGYGASTILPYERIAGTSVLRFPSTLGGPNQLGTYLILPLALSLMLALRRRAWGWLAFTAAALIVLIGTYSRGAWIGAATALAITLLAGSSARLRRPLLIGVAALGLVTLIAVPLLIAHSPHVRDYLLHQSLGPQPSSDAQHASSLRDGTRAVLDRPLGHGLGTAGPATFHAGTINIIEDYYLQLGYETGLLGLAAFISLITALLLAVRQRSSHLAAIPIAAAIIGISMVALVLPSWTDSSTALIVFVAAGAVSGLPAGGKHVYAD